MSINANIDPSDFPSIQTLTKQPLASHYAATRLITHAVASALLVIVGLAGILQPWVSVPDALHNNALWILPAIATVLLVRLVFQWFADKSKFYALRELDLTYFSGLLVKRTLVQPLNRIQHIEVSQGPIERLAKLAKLHVYSAGSASQTFAIPGLHIETAHQLRQHLLNTLPQQSFEQDEPQ